MSKNSSRKISRAARSVVFGLGRGIAAAAEGIDSALKFVAEKPLDRLYDRNEKAALQVKEYADIEAKRHIPGERTIILTSEEHGLDWDAFERQMEIRSQVSRHPWWEGMARVLINRPLSGAVSSVRRAGQRVKRGWDETATWSLDTHLGRTLGSQLIALAEVSHGWPQSDEFPEYEDWTAALRAHGATLIEYGRKHDTDLTMEQETALYTEAQKSLRWVADNLGSLWD